MVSSYRIAWSQNQTVEWNILFNNHHKHSILNSSQGKWRFLRVLAYFAIYTSRRKLKTTRQVVFYIIEFLLFPITKKKTKTKAKDKETNRWPAAGINSTIFRFKKYRRTNTIIIIFWSTNFSWFMKTRR